MNVRGCVPTKLYLYKQATGQIWPGGLSLPAPNLREFGFISQKSSLFIGIDSKGAEETEPKVRQFSFPHQLPEPPRPF